MGHDRCIRHLGVLSDAYCHAERVQSHNLVSGDVKHAYGQTTSGRCSEEAMTLALQYNRHGPVVGRQTRMMGDISSGSSSSRSSSDSNSSSSMIFSMFQKLQQKQDKLHLDCRTWLHEQLSTTCYG